MIPGVRCPGIVEGIQKRLILMKLSCFMRVEMDR